MEQSAKTELVHHFFLNTGPTYDFMVNLCTLGFDRSWKKEILKRIPKGSIRILDQACGTGILTFQIAQKFPRSWIVGVDLLEEYLSVAREKARRQRFKNVQFVLGRAEEILLHENLDCITSSYLAKYAALESLTQNAKRMLQSGGVLIMHDFTYPPNRAFACLWEFYFRILQSAGKWKYPEWNAVFEGLPRLLRGTKWTTELVKLLRQNAFSGISVQPFVFGTSAIVTAKKD